MEEELYVYELPNDCKHCVCCENLGKCKIINDDNFFSCHNERRGDCPLKLISQHDLEVKKQVLEELREWVSSEIVRLELAFKKCSYEVIKHRDRLNMLIKFGIKLNELEGEENE